MVSTAAKHTKPHQKQAVSHPPTKTPQPLTTIKPGSMSSVGNCPGPGLRTSSHFGM
ncbi:hypothetical protein DIJ64_10535 [Mycobacterium leprae]|uniref:Uncharacterized protein n=1 Tax=Mycobacterium leprae TaxID=1769 RepID=A0AAD0P583_MYCLR|nr:hypothetical protein DIJ64_10535 [Mycobacterium leprae]